VDAESILGLLPDPVIIVDREGLIEWRSGLAAELLGNRPMLVDPGAEAEVAAYLTLIGTAIADGVSESSLAVRDRHNRLRMMTWRCRAVSLPEDQTWRVQCVGSDLTTDRRLRERMLVSYRRFRLIADNATDILIRTAADGTIVWASPALERETGLRAEAVVGLKVWALVADVDEYIRTLQEDARAGTHITSAELQLRTTSDSSIWVALRSGPFVEDDGSHNGRILTLRNVTGEIEARQALESSELQFRRAVHDAPVGMVVTDLRGHLVLANPALAEFLQRPLCELHLLRWDDILAPGDLAAVRAQLRGMASGVTQVYRADVQCLRGDGSLLHAHLSVSSLRDGNDQPQGFIAQVIDQSALRSALAKLAHQAEHDELTDLPNRTSALGLISEYLSAATPTIHVGLLFCDVDDFKNINDNFGHEVGDQVLTALANRLRAVVGAENHIARLGGDEFIVLLPRVGAVRDAELAAEAVLRAVDEPFIVNGRSHGIGVSIGIAVTDAPTTTEQLLRDADAAMYLAKERGGHQWAITPPPPR
jgi:diguanylate cyclase (GGDEF)-like protein/PAS domain S-box-containing protein